MTDNPRKQVSDIMIASLPEMFTSTIDPDAGVPGPTSPEAMEDVLSHYVTHQAQFYVLKQYEGRLVCPIVTFDKIEWEIIGRAEDARKYVIDHDCEGCQAGKAKAETYLANHPDQNLIFVAVHHTEDWPIGTVQQGNDDDRVPVEEL